MGTNLGSKHYSKKELVAINIFMDQNNLSKKPLSLKRLSLVVAKELNRPSEGVYYKMLASCTQKPAYQRSKRVAVKTNMLATKQVTFGKPTKIEISDAGMTFFFN